jgi:hypothetical protein
MEGQGPRQSGYFCLHRIKIEMNTESPLLVPEDRRGTEKHIIGFRQSVIPRQGLEDDFRSYAPRVAERDPDPPKSHRLFFLASSSSLMSSVL